ncbi:MAG TPA: cytochrome c [Anaeromyxobacteraceae bacterium]
MRLSTRSAAAVAALLVCVHARAAAPPKRTPELLEKGRVSFKLNCASCHGETGKGDGVSAQALDPKPRNFAVGRFKYGAKPPQIFATLGKGIPGTAMIAFTQLPDEERWALAYYVSELRGRARAAGPAKGGAAEARP